MNKNLENCICGRQPKLLKRKLSNSEVDYVYYECECGQGTFGTRLEEFCRELWNSSQKRLKDISKKKKS